MPVSRDDLIMGSLASLDAYRGEWPRRTIGFSPPSWSNAALGALAVDEPVQSESRAEEGTYRSDERPVAYGPPDNPWARGVQAAQDIEARPVPRLPPAPGYGAQLRGIGGRMGDLADQAMESFRVPAGIARENPYPRGSEEWQQLENIKADRAAQFGGEWALNTLGIGRLGGGVKGGLGVGGGKIVQPEGIRAYHSSPHDFEKFDLSKIGTGEGAQVYGHGLYFSENPAVSGQGGQYWNQFLNRFPENEQLAARLLQEHGFDRRKVLSLLDKDRELLKSWEADPTPSLDIWKQEAANRRAFFESGKPIGSRTYEVNIKARPEQFLDWDKPPHSQPQRVMDVLYPEVNPAELDIGDIHNVLRTGERVSRDLNEAGIPGIKYLDQGSRNPFSVEDIAAQRKIVAGLDEKLKNTPQLGSDPTFNRFQAYDKLMRDKLAAMERPQTSNYVVFDPGLIDILKKYGLAGLTAGGATTMGALAEQGRYQPQE